MYSTYKAQAQINKEADEIIGNSIKIEQKEIGDKEEIDSEREIRQEGKDFDIDGDSEYSKEDVEKPVSALEQLATITKMFSSVVTNDLSYMQFIKYYILAPLLSGVMVGFGEMVAGELAIIYGWRSAPLYFFDRLRRR